MAEIINFPRAGAAPVVASQAPKGRFNARGRSLLGGVVRFVWVVVVLVWPVLKWIVSLDVFFQFVRMLYHWKTPDMYVGWTFLVHFSVLTALTYFVSAYKPKGI